MSSLLVFLLSMGTLGLLLSAHNQDPRGFLEGKQSPIIFLSEITGLKIGGRCRLAFGSTFLDSIPEQYDTQCIAEVSGANMLMYASGSW